MKKKVKKISKNEEFSLAGEYSSAWNFIKESREFIYIVILGFAIFLVIGFFFEDVVQVIFHSFLGIDLRQSVLSFIEKLVHQTEGMGQGQLIGFIFFNNLQSSFMGMIFGAVLGIFTIFSIITNGYLLGFVASLSVESAGIFVLWRILPHGIFELPALFIALGLGLRLGTFVFREEKKSFGQNLIDSLKVFLLIVVPLLIIAAFIEGSLIFLS